MDASILASTVEVNLIERVEKFFKEVRSQGLEIDIVQPKENPQTEFSILTHKIIKGAYIDRPLNLHKTEYFVSKLSGGGVKYTLAKEKKTGLGDGRMRHPKANSHIPIDENVCEGYVDKDRSSYSVN